MTLLSVGWTQSSQPETGLVPTTSGGIAISTEKRDAAGVDPVTLVRLSAQAAKESAKLARYHAFSERHHQRGLDASGRQTGWHSRSWDVIGLEAILFTYARKAEDSRKTT